MVAEVNNFIKVLGNTKDVFLENVCVDGVVGCKQLKGEKK